jgi:hypothetical protein
MAKRPETVPDRKKARDELEKLWETVLNDEALTAPDPVSRLINHDQVSIRFCLPTQLLGKLTDHSLDAMSLQRGDGSDGKWDPRGFASQVIVPWNRKNQNVLGASGDPYVSNPLRRPRVDSGLDQAGDREGWENLGTLLTQVQEKNDPEHTKQAVIQVLTAIRERLKELTFVYVLPDRISRDQAVGLAKQFLSEKSGGDRGVAVAAAAFEAIRERLGHYTEVRRGVVNASDAATLAAGDLECTDHNGEIILAVEVKERLIRLEDVQAALIKAREAGVKELIICSHGPAEKDYATISSAIDNAWASGTNIYSVTIGDFLLNVLPILGEQGGKSFIANVGKQLDKFNTQPKHRKAWKELLDGL